MTDVPLEDARQAQLIYVLYLVGLVVGVTTVVGVVWAHLANRAGRRGLPGRRGWAASGAKGDGCGAVARGDSVDWLLTHFRYQIRTFWLAVLYAVIGLALLLVGIGVLVLMALFIWWIVRCVKGLRQLERRQPVENVETWVF